MLFILRRAIVFELAIAGHSTLISLFFAPHHQISTVPSGLFRALHLYPQTWIPYLLFHIPTQIHLINTGDDDSLRTVVAAAVSYIRMSITIHQQNATCTAEMYYAAAHPNSKQWQFVITPQMKRSPQMLMMFTEALLNGLTLGFRQNDHTCIHLYIRFQPLPNHHGLNGKICTADHRFQGSVFI